MRAGEASRAAAAAAAAAAAGASNQYAVPQASAGMARAFKARVRRDTGLLGASRSRLGYRVAGWLPAKKSFVIKTAEGERIMRGRRQSERGGEPYRSVQLQACILPVGQGLRVVFCCFLDYDRRRCNSQLLSRTMALAPAAFQPFLCWSKYQTVISTTYHLLCRQCPARPRSRSIFDGRS